MHRVNGPRSLVDCVDWLIARCLRVIAGVIDFCTYWSLRFFGWYLGLVVLGVIAAISLRGLNLFSRLGGIEW